MGLLEQKEFVLSLKRSTARKWVGLILDGRQPAREGAEVYQSDIKVGTVTSGGFLPV